jgi:tryptophan-specific transport protein
LSTRLANQPGQGKTSLAAGITIVAGTAVGAGMFSLPIVSAGMWFSWSLLLLLGTWFCMYHSSLMILETNLNFEPGASFDTFVRETLGPRWNAVNGLTLTFVLYILTYAYISGGGSIVSHTLENTVGMSMPQTLAGLVFALGLAFIVWYSTALVGRMTTILVGGMIITFALSAGDLSLRVQMPILMDNQPGYALYSLAAIPYFLTSFGYHGCVPSLMKYYGRDPARIRACLLYGSLTSLVVYTLWHVATLGNIPRESFKPIIAAGGNIGDLVGALNQVVDEQRLTSLLNAFANMAVVSSFLGVTLGLFDFIADRFKFDNSAGGRFKTAVITFLPPTVGGLLFPDGFLYAIGLAGLCACMWGTIVPALAAKRSRELFGNPLYRVWGANSLVYFIIGYGVLLLLCYLLAAAGVLPRW